MRRWLSFALLLLAGAASADIAGAESDAVPVAQAQPTPIQTPAGAQPLPTAPPPAAPAQAADTQGSDAQAVEEPIGNVAALTGKASVKRNEKSIPLALKDDIYLNDVVQRSPNSFLALTFSDGPPLHSTPTAHPTLHPPPYPQ